MLEELKIKINNSGWEDKNKQLMLSLLPVLGENYLVFLKNESEKMGFKFVGDSLTEAIDACVLAEKKLTQGDASEIEKVLEVAPNYGWWENGAFVLPWVLDLQKKIKNNKNLQDLSIQDTLNKFYLSKFLFIPDYILTQLLGNFIVGILRKHKVEMLFLLKQYIYKKHWEGDSKYTKSFVDALLSNAEILSKNQIQIDGKDLSMSISNVLKDFTASSSRASSKLTVYDITKYLISNKNALLLDQENKEILLEVLKIFLWLQDPIVTRKELDSEYENNETDTQYSNSQYFKMPSELLTQIEPPIIPAPKNQPMQRPMEEIEKIPNIKLQIPNEDARAVAKPVVKPVNIEEVLKKRPVEEDLASPGLRMWNSTPPEIQKKPTVDIDKKLEDLKKKVQK